MYKAKENSQISFTDFNQPMGLHMNPNNRWVKLAELVPWDEYEAEYADLFKSNTGNVAKPFRMALYNGPIKRDKKFVVCKLDSWYNFQ